MARSKAPSSWLLVLIASPAAVAIWGGWVGLGALCGFGVIHPLPGIWEALTINTAITLPIGVEAYGTYALRVWLGGRPGRARTFARRSSIGSLALGATGQVAYHLLAAGGATRAPEIVIVLVSCMPVATLGFAAALVHLQHADAAAEAAPAGIPAAPGDATGDATVSATEMPGPEAIEGPGPEATEMPPAEATREPAAMPVESREPEPSPRPRRAATGLSKDQDADKARKAYQRSVRDGEPLTDRALGDAFGRSRTWGASRIREAKELPSLSVAR